MADHHAAVLAAVTSRLADLHQRMDGAAAEQIAFTSWIRHSGRGQRQRLFVRSEVDSVARLVAKVPLDPTDRMVDREWQVMTTLPDQQPARPHPLLRLERGFVMTYVPARDLADVLADTESPAWPGLLGDALETVAVFHRAARPGSPAEAARAAAVYLPRLDAVPPEALGVLDAAAVGPCHGDLGVWNIRIAESGASALIDWEDYQPFGLPGMDVVNVVLTASLVAFPDYRERGFGWLYEQVFHERNAFREAIDTALDRYARLTGVDPVDVMRLTPLFCRWMIRRFRLQGRPTGHLFYRPFAERFESEVPARPRSTP